MALPKLQSPIFELIVPSTGKKLKYRPFLVKEEKILLIAKESKTPEAAILAFKQIINNCVLDNFDVENAPVFDLEYIFLMIRARSQSNISELVIMDDEKEYKATINFDEVEIRKSTDHSLTIDLDGSVGVVMRYPSLADMEELELLSGEASGEKVMELMQRCIDKVYDTDDVYPMKDASKEEKQEFFDSLTNSYLQKIQTFFSGFPKIIAKAIYKKEGKLNSKEIAGLANFL